MSRPQYSLDAYKRVLEYQSKNKKIRLLVEGDDDRKIFRLLISKVSDGKDDPKKFRQSIAIDVAEYLIKIERPISEENHLTDKIGEREKVEIACRIIGKGKYANQLIGFVDREFREFQLGHSLKDLINDHRIENRLVWSRGHSIENYFFDRLMMKDLLRTQLDQDWFQDALDYIDKFFDSAILYACAISLAVRDTSIEERIEKFTQKVDCSIDHKLFILNSSELELRYNEWEERLQERLKFSPQVTMKIVRRTKDWTNRLRQVDSDIHRWLCRGHTGFKLICALLDFCVLQADPDSKGPRNRLGNSNLKNSKRLNHFANNWIEKAISNDCIHPFQELESLGLKL